MKRILSCLFISFMTTICQGSFAAAPTTGSFFDINVVGPTLIIRTTTGNHFYPSAGIKINTVGYIFAVAGQCEKMPSGYCIFPVSNTIPGTITIVGAVSTPLVVTICLNGLGPFSCQLYSPPV